MAALNIYVDLSNGQELILPSDIVGSVSQLGNPPQGQNLTALARQIDDNGLVTILIANNPPFPVPISFELTYAECPEVNVWYMLTIYAWDSLGDCTVQSVTFKRVPEPAPLGGGLPPP
jgi:hypothetical protein